MQSFNYDGSSACSTGCMLNDELYQVCFRPEKGMCTTAFSQTSVATTLESFGLNGEQQTDAEQTAASCTHSYVVIHSLNGDDDNRYCGKYLSQGVAATTGGVIYAQTSNGFNFRVNSEEDNENAHAGFSLEAQQLACGQSTFGGGASA